MTHHPPAQRRAGACAGVRLCLYCPECFDRPKRPALPGKSLCAECYEWWNTHNQWAAR